MCESYPPSKYIDREMQTYRKGGDSAIRVA